MKARTPFITTIALAALLACILPTFGQKPPIRYVLETVPYVNQLKDYCGPAALSMVLGYWGKDMDQNTIGEAVFDKSIRATNGADMMLYARSKGLSAYSWNSSLKDLKKKLARGIPVIILQDCSDLDRSGHYRVAIGYDDEAGVVLVKDPYDPKITEYKYDTFEDLWRRYGNWSLLVCPAEKDRFKKELDEQNPVVHIDLAYIYYKRGELEAAQRESRLALALEPGNRTAQNMLAKAIRAAGARDKSTDDQDVNHSSPDQEP